MERWWMYAGFTAFVLVMLALDLGVFNRKAHAVRAREAAIWTGVWVSLAMVFAFFLYRWMGREAALQFLAGWLVEKSLSVDNIFVFILVFGYFGVPPRYQHRVLFWGILGALVMRGAMIAAGAVLLERFHWLLYVFGAFLIYTGVRMARQGEREMDMETQPVLRFVRARLPITGEYHGQRFFVRCPGPDGKPKRYVTPLFIVLIVLETTDLVFAVDSIPAVFAVTRDPFLVYTSNVFAILGLRSLYFLLADVVTRFHLLKVGLGVVLCFVGAKMLLEDVVEVPIGISLAVIATVIGGSVALSILFPRQAKETDVTPPTAEAKADAAREAAEEATHPTTPRDAA
ncbi:MAG TPA: TerC family protein [Longimicrobium sp.]|nr:TerC family protein [Longimicrobium sp.]